MSEFSKATTQFKDAESLIAALAAMGYPRENIEVHAEPQQLFDYRGRKTTYLSKDGDKANIIIRRKHIGGLANDMGYVWDTALGSYGEIISQYDSTAHFPESWRNGLKVAYAENATIKKSKLMGARFSHKTNNNGKTQLHFVKAG